MPEPAPATTRTLSEAASKELLAPFGVPFPPERTVHTADEAVEAGEALGFPVVAKLCGEGIAHKTERGLVRLGLHDATAVRHATVDLLAAATEADGPVSVLVAPMLSGRRELIAGLATDAQFGPTVMLGVGGVLAEALADVALRLVPLARIDAEEMIEDLRTQTLLGELRGEPPVDRVAVADVVLALSAATEAHAELVSVDLNPLLVVAGRPVAVDALVEVVTAGGSGDGDGDQSR